MRNGTTDGDGVVGFTNGNHSRDVGTTFSADKVLYSFCDLGYLDTQARELRTRYDPPT